MLRKTMKTALLASVALSALVANIAIADDSAFDGVYLGAEAGAGLGDASGALGGLYAGYGAAFDSFYFGGEMYGHARDLDDTQTKQIAGVGSAKLKEENDRAFGLSLRPGILVGENTLFYGRLGYETGHFHLKSATPGMTLTGKTDTNLLGLVLGGGVEYAVNSMENVKLRLDYRFVNYENLKYRINGVSDKMKTPNQHHLMVGVAYTF